MFEQTSFSHLPVLEVGVVPRVSQWRSTAAAGTWLHCVALCVWVEGDLLDTLPLWMMVYVVLTRLVSKSDTLGGLGGKSIGSYTYTHVTVM